MDTTKQPIGAAPQAAPALPAPEQPAHEPRPVRAEQPDTPAASRPDGPSLYDKITRTIALLFALVVGGALWYADGFFTLFTLDNMGLKLAAAGGWRWLIPVAITATTIAFWPRKQAPAKRASTDELRRRRQARAMAVGFFLAIVGFNVGTSFAGMIEWAGGRHFPLFVGITIPQTGAPLWIAAGVAAVVLAFGPEKLWRWAASDLWKLWS